MENQENLRKIISILKYPVISDKSTRLLESNKYTFMVDRYANKTTIKNVIEYIFNVKVIKINTLLAAQRKRTVGKFVGNRAQYKKAIVTLKTGNKIDLFPDM